MPSSGDPVSGLGTQNALLGGGRYDGLSEMLGGPKAPGIGFAIGEDRLILTLQAQAAAAPQRQGCPIHRSLTAMRGTTQARRLHRTPRPRTQHRRPRPGPRATPGWIIVEVGDGTFRLKKSFEAADRVARHIVILGEDELASGILTVKTFCNRTCRPSRSKRSWLNRCAHKGEFKGRDES